MSLGPGRETGPARGPSAGGVQVLLLLVTLAPPVRAAPELELARGAAFFGQPWRGPPGEDTVGPLFAAEACADCHPGGGAGDPSGPALVFRPLAAPEPFGRQLQPRSVPGVPAEPRPSLAWERVPGSAGQSDPRPVWRIEGAPVAARLAPNLRGVGLLARVRDADLAAAADPADADGDGVSGEVAWRPAGAARKPGRFGWKAEAASLGEQVAMALALDLGIATSAHPDPAGDCTPAQLACRAQAGAGAPVAPAALAALKHYLEALRPWPGPPAPAADRGEALFAEVGCAACHRPSFTVASDPAVTGRTTERIAPFTDLLLHDLGSALADPGGPAGLAAEWRTAPLWGLRSRAALLHDGRAATPLEAILWHGGEAAAARARFLALPPADRAQLTGFLSRL